MSVESTLNLADDKVPADLARGFSYSKRSEPVDYQQIARDSAEALHSASIAKGWAISLNLEGLKRKDGRFIEVSGVKHTYDNMLDQIQQYNISKGYISDPSKSSRSSIHRMDTGKQAITPARIARAFARVTIAYLKSVPAANHFPEGLAPGLPAEHRFLNSPYGLTNSELHLQASGLATFFKNWDAHIANMWSKSYVKPEDQSVSKRRTWNEEFLNYLAYRGFSVSTPGSSSS